LNWDSGFGSVLMDPDKRAMLRGQIMRFFAAYPVYRGLSLDFESLDDSADPAYVSFIRELYADMHARNLRLYVNTVIATDDDELRQIAANSDGLILMNYDEHEESSNPGPVASLLRVLRKSVNSPKLLPERVSPHGIH